MNQNHRIPGNRSYLFGLTLLASCISNVVWANDLAAIEDLSLSDLMKIEVSSASRKSQSLSDTAAAAFVISQEDIRRSGATSIPDALRLAPGIEVAQITSSSWAITSRGFNGKYANKLLVLMDGRTIYTPLFSGVFWGLQDTMMEDIERIEVIRGPGAAMWGANAVNGVINIITKKTKDTPGNLAVAGAGNQEQGFAAFRHGGKFGDDGSFRIYGKGFARAGSVDSAGQKQPDGWQSGQFGFRIDNSLSTDDRLTLQGDAYHKTVGSLTNATTVLPPFNTAIDSNEHGRGANLLARWERSLETGSEFTLQTYYDRVSFTAPSLSDSEDTLDIDFQHRLHPDISNDLMWGFNYRYIRGASTNTAAISFTPSTVSYNNASVFVQDDIALSPNKLRLTLGGKLEKSHFGGTQFQPNARLLWTPDSMHSVWASISRAARTPSRGETQSTIALGVLPTGLPAPFNLAQVVSTPNANLIAEKVTAIEAGYRAQWNDRLSSDIAVFGNRYSNLTILAPGAFNPFTLTQPMQWINSAQSTNTRGVEVSADWDMLDSVRLTGSYSHLRMQKPFDPANLDITGPSPVNHGSLHCQLNLNESNRLGFTVRHVNKLVSGGATIVPAYTAVDARYAYRLQKRLELSLIGQNLFSPKHMEYNSASALIPGSAPSLIPRSVYLKMTWSD